MSWPRAFLAVPTGALAVDPDVQRESPKAPNEDISRWMGQVPQIYGMLERGVSDADFHRMSVAPASPQDRELAETYRHLFSNSASAQPLRAELGDDGRLTVVAGQHRVRAAQEAGVPLVPVHVSARDDAALCAVRSSLETEARAVQASAADVHRVYDARWCDEREREQTAARSER